MSKMLTGGAGLNAEYVTVPVAVAARLSAGLAEQANTSGDPATVVVSGGQSQAVVSARRPGVTLGERHEAPNRRIKVCLHVRNRQGTTSASRTGDRWFGRRGARGARRSTVIRPRRRTGATRDASPSSAPARSPRTFGS